MLNACNPRVVTIGEAMVEIAPVGDGLFRKGFAGDTYNTGWHLAQLLDARARVGFVTRVGVDRLSEDFVGSLAADGLDTSGISRDPVRTMGLYLISLDGVERRFDYWRESSAARHLAEDADALQGAVSGAALILVSGITLAILSPGARETLFAVLAAARGEGATVAFDPNLRPRLWASPDVCRATVGAMLKLTDLALPSFEDEALLWADTTPAATIARLADKGVAEAVVKNGAGEGLYLSPGGTGALPTPAVSGVRDTTGAGDAFNAGYLAARLTGAAVPDAVGSGQAVAGLVIRHPGAKAPKEALLELAARLGQGVGDAP